MVDRWRKENGGIEREEKKSRRKYKGKEIDVRSSSVILKGRETYNIYRMNWRRKMRKGDTEKKKAKREGMRKQRGRKRGKKRRGKG